MDKIRAIIDKEWEEIFKNKMVLFTVIFLPLFFTAMPLAILQGISSAPGMAGLPPQLIEMCNGRLGGSECVQYLMVSQFLMLFMMMPIIIPVTISAYSIVGEKTTHCLEPLLATPISTLELILGKALAAAIPAILATWGGFVLFMIGVRVLGAGPALFNEFVAHGAVWLIAIGIVSPLMAMASIIVTIMISARVSDPRSAEQIAALLILPLLGGFFAQLTGVMILDLKVILISTAILLLVDAGLAYAGTKVFQRETILTQWK